MEHLSQRSQTGTGDREDKEPQEGARVDIKHKIKQETQEDGKTKNKMKGMCQGYLHSN